MERIRIVLVRVTQNPKAYLNVEPESMQWIDINNPVEYSVLSNVNWIVE